MYTFVYVHIYIYEHKELGAIVNTLVIIFPYVLGNCISLSEGLAILFDFL